MRKSQRGRIGYGQTQGKDTPEQVGEQRFKACSDGKKNLSKSSKSHPLRLPGNRCRRIVTMIVKAPTLNCSCAAGTAMQWLRFSWRNSSFVQPQASSADHHRCLSMLANCHVYLWLGQVIDRQHCRQSAPAKWHKNTSHAVVWTTPQVWVSPSSGNNDLPLAYSTCISCNVVLFGFTPRPVLPWHGSTPVAGAVLSISQRSTAKFVQKEEAQLVDWPILKRRRG